MSDDDTNDTKLHHLQTSSIMRNMHSSRRSVYLCWVVVILLSVQEESTYGMGMLRQRRLLSGWSRRWALLGCCYGGCCNLGQALSSISAENTTSTTASFLKLDGEDLEVIVVKLGGSSLTHKANKETMDDEALQWFSRAIARSMDVAFLSPTDAILNGDDDASSESCATDDIRVKQSGKKRKRAFVVIHGAGTCTRSTLC